MKRPALITAIEKENDIKLKKVAGEVGMRESGSYVANAEGEVTGLNLYQCTIRDFGILEKFVDLEYLDLGYIKPPHYDFLPKLTKLKSLHLSGNGISDGSFLPDLPHLELLNLYTNAISDISFLDRMPGINQLFLGGNHITDISALKQLNLVTLAINANKISDIGPLRELTNIIWLDLGQNPISDLSPIHTHDQLKSLYLGNLQVSEFDFLKICPLLRKLELSGNEITDYTFLLQLPALKELFLNEVKALDIETISNLKSLYTLSLNTNNLQQVDFLKDHLELTRLELSSNQIVDVSPLARLTNLQHLDLAFNQISDIEPLLPIIKTGLPITLEYNWEKGILNLEGNPLDKSLKSLIKKGNDAIIRHFERIEEQGVAHIFEAKVTFVGEGGSGKTSLQSRLMDPEAELPREDTRTRGIQISHWYFDKQKQHIAHVWDFGGQDVYYPVHRFFLTENSLFLLLASTRHAQHNFNYWIPTIYQFGGHSPIILVQTCHMGHKTAWNDLDHYVSNPDFNIIKTKVPAYYEMNLPENNYGLEAIRKIVIDQINSLPQFGKAVPASWVPVRKAISKEAEKNSCISIDAFTTICRQVRPTEFQNLDDVYDCAKFLHFLGVVLWYSENEELKNWVILQPQWAVNAVYKIIDDTQNNDHAGIITSEDFDRLWCDDIYKGKHSILKKMLQMFKIAFPKKHKKEDYIVPARLNSISSDDLWNQEEPCLRIDYQFQFMPKGLINQISAELSRLIISDHDVWNNAVNLTNDIDTAQAQVYEDFYNRTIHVKAKGKDARGLIMIVMNSIKDIIGEYKGVKADIIVPCTCPECRKIDKPFVFKYEDLLRWSQRRSTVTCNESGESLTIDELLFNIGLNNPEKNKRSKEVSRLDKPLQTFISYSKFDGESNKDGVNYLEDFKKHLAPLFESNLITSWDDTYLLAGDEWDEKIKAQLRSSDIVFFLVSKDFLTTKYIKDTEFKIAIERHHNKECLVIPIIIKPCGWCDIPVLSKISGIPRKGNTIASWQKNIEWKSIDDAWVHIYDEVKKMINNFKEGRESD